MVVNVAQPDTKTVRLHAEQSQAFASNARFIALIAGTGGGKTFFGGPWLCNEISQYPGDQWFILAPTYKILSRATMPTFIDFVQGTEYEGEYKEAKGIYVLPDGGVIYCVSTDNWKGIEGGQFRAAWLDEAGQMSHMAWVAVQARLGLKQGRCLFTTTPYPTASSDWLLVDIVEQAIKHPEIYYSIQFSSIANPYYPKEEYYRMKEVLPDALFQMRYDGKFTKLSGLVYPTLDVVYSDDAIDPINFHPEWQRIGGIDWGFRDPFVAIVAAVEPHNPVTGDPMLHLFYEHYQTQTTLQQHANVLKRDGMEETLYFADPSGAQQIADMQAQGLAVTKGINDILAGIETVNKYANLPRLKVYRKQCPMLVTEAARYRYPSEEEIGASAKNAGEKPMDKDNHVMDALRYMIKGYDAGMIHFSITDITKDEKRPTTAAEHHERYGDWPAQPINEGTPAQDTNGTAGNKSTTLVAKRREAVAVLESNQPDIPNATLDDLEELENAWLSEDNPAIWSNC